MNRLFFLVLLSLTTVFNSGDVQAQKSKEKPQITWLTFEQLKDSMAVHPKKIFIDIYAEWCGPCKLMDKKSFPNKYVVRAMNESYYAVKLDAERKDTIEVNGKQYSWEEVRNGRGANTFALQIGMEAGTLSYPTLVILDENYQLIYRYPSFLNAILLEEVLIQYK